MKEMGKKIIRLIVVCINLGVSATILLECIGFWYAIATEAGSVQNLIDLGKGWAFAVMPVVTILSINWTISAWKKYRNTKLIEG